MRSEIQDVGHTSASYSVASHYNNLTPKSENLVKMVKQLNISGKCDVRQTTPKS